MKKTALIFVNGQGLGYTQEQTDRLTNRCYLFADRYSYEVVKTVVVSGNHGDWLESALELADRLDVVAFVAPSYWHIDNDPRRVLRYCRTILLATDEQVLTAENVAAASVRIVHLAGGA